MKYSIKDIDYAISAKALICLCVAIIMFHLMIVFAFIPYDIVWGGRLTSTSEMYKFESVSFPGNFNA